jgi:glutamyl-tRNA reductase|tara:strand:+ start:281 stop:1522 length:1242 start_codon:yes stop_codon:yes gene_type:complete
LRSDKIYAIGINHLSNVPGKNKVPSITDMQKCNLYRDMLKAEGTEAFMTLNTCNRLEFYGIGNKDLALAKYIEILGGDKQYIPFVYSGDEAILHLFQMASGIGSQLIGDLEIIGQFKRAVAEAKDIGSVSGYFKRLADSCIKSAKYIRNTTSISDGTTSLSYAVIEYLKNNNLREDKKILLIGVGSFGTNIARNLVHYFPKCQLTLSNRTSARAVELGKETGAQVIDYSTINEQANYYDIVITAVSGLSSPILTADTGLQKKVIIDLSSPSSVDDEIGDRNVVISNEDLSKIINKTLDKRNADLPKAHEIISNEIKVFKDWSNFYQKSESARILKSDVLEQSMVCPFLMQIEPEVVSGFVNEMIGSYVQFIKNNDANVILNNELPLEYIKQNKNSFSKVLQDFTRTDVNLKGV